MNNSTELLTVVKVSEDRTDKNGRNYKVVTFQSPNTIEIVDATTGELLNVRVPARRSSITRYEESYLDNQMHYMYDAVVGEKVPGQIVTREVPAYEIDGRAVTNYTTVVLGMTNEPAFESAIKQAFKSAGHDYTLLSTEETVVEDRVSMVKEEVVSQVEEDAAF